MKKIPTNRELATLFLTGLGCLSFGLIFIWIPVLGDMFLLIGGSLLLISILSIIVKMIK